MNGSKFLFLLIVLIAFFSCTNSQIQLEETVEPEIIAQRCEQSGCWDSKYHVCRDQKLINLFTRKTGWTGGDATYSVKLPNGKTLWMFGDTFINQVNNDGTRSSFRLINNSMVLQNEEEMTAYHTGTITNPGAFAKPPESNWWYWPGDATVATDTLFMFMQGFGNDSGGAWDFYRTSIDLLKMNPETLEIYKNERIFTNPEITFGSAILEDVDYTYLYGVKAVETDKYLYVARSNANLNKSWEYFTGVNWSNDINDAKPIYNNVSEQFSVFKDNETYYLLTQHHIFGAEITLFHSNSPIGPWGNGKVIYCTPESAGNIFTYNAFAHPEIHNDSLVISYNVNSFDTNDLLKDVNNYRPYFIRVGNWRN